MKADSRPFKIEVLDCEGRCLLTDHGSFVVINVYVPNSGQNHKRFPFKMKFLSALQSLVHAQKESGKQVILVGDFNVAPAAVDVCRPNRQMHIPSVLAFSLRPDLAHWSGGSGSARLYSETRGRWLDESELQQLILAVQWLRWQWPGIERSLRLGMEVVPEGNRYRVMGTRALDGKKVRMGSPVTSCPTDPYSLEAKQVTDESTGTVYPLREAGYLYFSDLRDCARAFFMSSAAEVDDGCDSLPVLCDRAAAAITQCGLDPSVKQLHLRADHWDLLADVFGEPAHVRSSVDWFCGLLKSEELVDSFACAYPSRQGRFTCWEQHSNRRYCNEGSRIDHILLGRELWATYGAPVDGGPLPGFDSVLASDAAGKTDDDSIGTKTPEWLQYAAALRACTADGMFQPAPFDGGGIPPAPAEAYQAHFRTPCTGIVYTPPEYSDHAGVSLYLHSSLTVPSSITTTSNTPVWQLEPQTLLRSDAATKLTQPHFKHTSIMAHFKRKPEGEATASTTSCTTTTTTTATTVVTASSAVSAGSAIGVEPPAKKPATTTSESGVIVILDDDELAPAAPAPIINKPGKITSFFKK